MSKFAGATLLSFVIALNLCGHAGAHGSASWIMQHPGYGWCCGPQDCFRLEPKEVRIEGDHYFVDRLAIRWSILGTFRSVDHHYWVCYFMRGTSYEQVKCFFAPTQAM